MAAEIVGVELGRIVKSLLFRGATSGRPVGSGYADITVCSFHPVKIVTTAEGGLATTPTGTRLAGCVFGDCGSCGRQA